MEKRKITIVGAGAVGSTTAFALAQSGLAKEIILQDINVEKTEAEALDITHGSLFLPGTLISSTNDPKDTKDSSIVIITAGAKQQPGQTRIELAGSSIKIMESILPSLVKFSPNAIFLIVSNPVDVLTFVAQKISKLSPKQLFGSGTHLDSSRLRTVLSRETKINPKSIHAYIVGEHGDSEVALWSSATIGNVPLLDFKELPGEKPLTSELRESLHKEVINAAYKVIEGKGATNYAIALATLDIVSSIMRDEKRIMPVSTLVEGIDEISNVCMSLPFIVGKEGVCNSLVPELSRDELLQLQKSGQMLREVLSSFGY